MLSLFSISQTDMFGLVLSLFWVQMAIIAVWFIRRFGWIDRLYDMWFIACLIILKVILLMGALMIDTIMTSVIGVVFMIPISWLAKKTLSLLGLWSEYRYDIKTVMSLQKQIDKRSELIVCYLSQGLDPDTIRKIIGNKYL